MEGRGKRSVLVLCLACLALASFCTSRGVGAQEDRPYLPREDCITNGEALLGDVSFLLENQDAVACASGAGVRCCRALNEYFGPNSTFWGCPCYADLFEEVRLFEKHSGCDCAS